MRFVVIVILMLMTALLAACGILLWRRRGETGDNSRTIQAVLSWISAFFTATFLFRTWAGTTTADGAFFQPEHTFIPLLALVFVGLCAGIEYTPIYTYADLWQHIWEPNVLLRLVTLTVMLFYAFSLFFVPYNWKSSSVSKNFILNYAFGFLLLGVLHFSIQITHFYWLVILHHVVWGTLFAAVAWYELKERLVAVPEAEENASVEEIIQSQSHPDELWEKILSVLDHQEQWRNPELTLTSLSRDVFSNRTYVGDAFKRNTGLTFSEYIAQRRIGYVADALKANPAADIKELFHFAGYRSRTAGWENFHKVTGVSPSDFIGKL